MDCRNLPVQAIVHFGADGELRPLRFRYEDQQHQIHTVQVDQITDSRKTEFVGIEALIYLCRATDAEGEHLYELKYTVSTHKWVLFRRLY